MKDNLTITTEQDTRRLVNLDFRILVGILKIQKQPEHSVDLARQLLDAQCSGNRKGFFIQ